MSEIVERLRMGGPNALEIADEAAAEISRLEARVKELENVMRGVAELRLTDVNGGKDNALMQTDRLPAARLVLFARNALGEKA